ncbi:helix-turn-helix domain-containing protein [Natrialbaceae archaeon A-arb3/5]
MSEESSLEDLFAVLDDEYARAILTETSTEPMSAKSLADACDASLPTIYRRIDRLSEHGLIEERTEFADEGRHYGVYKATLDRIVIELGDEEFTADVTTTSPDPADRFTQLWEDI